MEKTENNHNTTKTKTKLVGDENAQIKKNNILALNKKSLAVEFGLTGSDFEAVENIGSGAYGVVCSAVDKRTGACVAIKKISNIFSQPTIAMRTYREIKILRHLKHENVIGIKNIFCSKENEKLSDIYIVFNLMESDLHRIIYTKQALSDEHVRYFVYQIVRGLKFIHSANILHRDLKPSNLLVNENCELKIGDFGMARGISIPGQSTGENNSERQLTHYVATRWYRAPELLLQFPVYSAGVDMWSVGCIMAELVNRKTLFPGRDMLHQLELIFNFAGVPSANYIDLSFSEKIKRFFKFKHELSSTFPTNVLSFFPTACDQALDLLSNLLQLDPNKRSSAQDVLNHPYLQVYADPSDEPTCQRLFDFSFEQEFKKLSGPENSDKLCKCLEESILQEIERYSHLKNFPAMLLAMSKNSSNSESKKDSNNVTTSCKDQFCTEINNNTKYLEKYIIQSATTTETCKPELVNNTAAKICENKSTSLDSDLNQQSNENETIRTRPCDLTTKSLLIEDSNDVDMISAKLESATIKDQDMASPSVSSDDSSQASKLSSPLLSQSRLNISVFSDLNFDDNTEKYTRAMTSSVEMPVLLTELQCCEKTIQQNNVNDLSLVSNNHNAATSTNCTISQDHDKSVTDAKAKIKAALLHSSEMRKERMRVVSENSKNTRHHVTAFQRQKEREEKRRLKHEKSLKKKERNKDVFIKSSDDLSSADKKLLERWNNMQKHLKVEHSTTSLASTNLKVEHSVTSLAPTSYFETQLNSNQVPSVPFDSSAYLNHILPTFSHPLTILGEISSTAGTFNRLTKTEPENGRNILNLPSLGSDVCKLAAIAQNQSDVMMQGIAPRSVNIISDCPLPDDTCSIRTTQIPLNITEHHLSNPPTNGKRETSNNLNQQLTNNSRHGDNLKDIIHRCNFIVPPQLSIHSEHLPTISTILPSQKDMSQASLKLNKEFFKFSDIKESQESAPLSATLLADWLEMTKEIDAGDLEAAVLDYEHGPTRINLFDVNPLQ